MKIHPSDTLVLQPPGKISQSQMRKMLTELNLDTENQGRRLHRRYKLHYKAPYIHVYDPYEPERVSRFIVMATALAEFHGEIKLKNSPLKNPLKKKCLS